ncbi:MAG: hypothetical protein HY376_02665 [Candidatus Blackburnbacteria bacterium]|nr:hypothetical protein [Candidatus Blackburnbacteria bacterium]
MVTAPARPSVEELALPEIKIGDTITVPFGAQPTHMRWSDDIRLVNVAFKLDRGNDIVIDLRNYDMSPHPCVTRNVVTVRGQFTLGGTTLHIAHFVFIGKDGTGSTMLSPTMTLTVTFPKRRFPTYQMGLTLREGFRGLGDVETRGAGPLWIKLPGTASWARSR